MWIDLLFILGGFVFVALVLYAYITLTAKAFAHEVGLGATREIENALDADALLVIDTGTDYAAKLRAKGWTVLILDPGLSGWGIWEVWAEYGPHQKCQTGDTRDGTLRALWERLEAQPV